MVLSSVSSYKFPQLHYYREGVVHMNEQLSELAKEIVSKKDLPVTYKELVTFLSEQIASSLQDYESNPGGQIRQKDHHEG